VPPQTAEPARHSRRGFVGEATRALSRPQGPAQVAYGTLVWGMDHMIEKSRGPEHTDRKWREAPGLLTICRQDGDPADDEPGDDAHLRVGE